MLTESMADDIYQSWMHGRSLRSQLVSIEYRFGAVPLAEQDLDR
jgi:hypothetical protein